MAIFNSMKKIFSVSVSADKPELQDFVKVVRTKGGQSLADIENSSAVTTGGGDDGDEEVIWGKKKQP